MDRHSRLNALLEIVAKEGKVDVAEAVEQLGVSAASIRRDLVYLDEQHLVTRVHGGAVSNSPGYDLPLRYKSQRQTDEKQRIGVAAAALADKGSIVAINGGTTALEVGRALAARDDLSDGDEPGLTVVTNALNLATELLARPFLRVVVTGGVVRSHSYELFGPLASRSLQALSFHTAYLGVDGFDLEFGASAYSDVEANVNAALATTAERVVVVADSTKIGVKAFAQICPPSRVNVLVTDAGISDEAKAALEKAGTEVIVA
ncbi:MAG: DeoR/GlpR family DNA-binding transcription regulator [Propionibacteriaceae bacterium]|nr:DeoR/GlpR family DNA-binding transcription regulator [Propionibacteriaceae bacterium]